MPLGQIEDSAFRTFIDYLLVKVRIAVRQGLNDHFGWQDTLEINTKRSLSNVHDDFMIAVDYQRSIYHFYVFSTAGAPEVATV